MKRRGKWKYIGLSLLLSCTLLSCGSTANVQGDAKKSASSGTQAEENTAEEEITLSEAAKNHATDGEEIIGISMPAQHLPRWNWDGQFLEQNFKDAGYTVNLKFADNTIDRQQQDIHELINEGVDILLIAAVKGDELSDVLQEATAAGIPVIAYDRIIDSDSVDYYVSFDNDMVGALQGEHIRDKLDLEHPNGRTFHIEIVSGDSNDKNADGYYNGAMGVLQPYIDNGTVVVESGETGYHETETFQWSSERAEERLSNILTAYYNDGSVLDAVLCANDTAALGCANAIENSYSGENQVLLTGQDGDAENLKNIMTGRQTQTSYKCLPHETKVMFDVTMAFMQGETIDESLIEECGWDFEVKYADDRYSNGTEYMKSFLLTPLSITKENLIPELVDKGFYTMNEDGSFTVVE